MATIKSYTDLQQSKKLAEILPLESADMFYDGVQDLYKERTYNIPINGSSITVRTGHVITEKGIKSNLLLPCWSLAALLSLLEHPRCFQGDKPIYWFCGCFGKDKLYHEVEADNPVDACYEMILKLKKINLL